MRLQIYLTKRLLTNPYLIGWGILFMIFWAIIGAFVESGAIPSNLPQEAYKFYTSGWYGVLVLLSFSAIGVGLTAFIRYHTGSIPYLLRYSRMKSADYISGITIASVITSLVYSLILLAIVDLLFSYHFGFQISPANIPLILLTSLLAGLFFLSFSLFVELLIVKYLGLNPATSQIVNFIPLILGYGFGFAALYSNLGNIVYASPFADIEYLLTEGYYGHHIYLNALVNATSVSSNGIFSVGIGFLALIAWIAILFAISLPLFNRIYYRSIYEEKIV
ncbi:hypothetical protein [Sulfurisphaera ohwakuensis]|uniref:ABC-2 type transport system permease protein n=1 Tax=Sulfurisphaera ohwakuensis TaxID=69656 RepID=A0A650CKC5_SULOH|nr:hypothetical protein [Sulfurisphaera ohwakuensis]MBB5254321.1 hypothetical protein [Sulfurisphaera ohwakuensis]QGR18212.1 hypothetical protein D1869_14205 [Sulfurisphaera ohwakuensis]